MSSGNPDLRLCFGKKQKKHSFGDGRSPRFGGHQGGGLPHGLHGLEHGLDGVHPGADRIDSSKSKFGSPEGFPVEESGGKTFSPSRFRGSPVRVLFSVTPPPDTVFVWHFSPVLCASRCLLKLCCPVCTVYTRHHR